MLSYNTPATDETAPGASCSDPSCNAHRTAHRAHAAHALVLGLHTVCCGLPVAATLLASGAVGLVGFAALETFALDLHERLHAYEGWILVVSAALVAIGGLAELAARRRGLRRFPAFFAVSVACLVVNAGLVVSHRLEAQSVQVAVAASTGAAHLPGAPTTAPTAETVNGHAAHDHEHHGHDHAH